MRGRNLLIGWILIVLFFWILWNSENSSPSAPATASPPVPPCKVAKPVDQYEIGHQGLEKMKTKSAAGESGTLEIIVGTETAAGVLKAGYDKLKEDIAHRNFILMRATMAPRELAEKQRQLAAAQEKEQQLRDTIDELKRSSSVVSFLLADQKLKHVRESGESAGIDRLRRKQMGEKEAALKSYASKIAAKEQELAQAVLYAIELRRELESKKTETHDCD